MKIEILGTGCAKCNALEANAKAAAEKLGIAYELRHVTDVTELTDRGVMITPALAIDGQVVVSGKVAGEDEIARLLTK